MEFPKSLVRHPDSLNDNYRDSSKEIQYSKTSPARNESNIIRMHHYNLILCFS